MALASATANVTSGDSLAEIGDRHPEGGHALCRRCRHGPAV